MHPYILAIERIPTTDIRSLHHRERQTIHANGDLAAIEQANVIVHGICELYRAKVVITVFGPAGGTPILTIERG